jgi:peptidyl-prolyl cis-trans isomerase C
LSLPSAMKGIRGILLVMLFAASSGCGGPEVGEKPETPRGAIVRVGNAVLTEEAMENLLPEGDGIPITAEEKKRFVQRWIDTEILYQEAMRRGLKEDPRVRARLRSLEQEFLADHLAFLELWERTAVSEEEIEEYFRIHENEYRYEYRVSHILVNTPEEAEEVKEQLKKNSFAWVANRYSIDPVARRGGDLGYLSKGNMIPELENVVFGMKPGEVSDIVKSNFGYHIVMLVGTRESLVTIDLVDIREQILNTLLMDRREKAYRDFLDTLRSRAAIAYADESYAIESVPDEADEQEAAGDPGEPDGLEESGETDEAGDLDTTSVPEGDQGEQR